MTGETTSNGKYARKVLLAAFLLLAGIDVSASGMVDGHLGPCTNPSNCVNSEYPGPAEVAPLNFEGDADIAWKAAIEAIGETGGELLVRDDDYAHATYTSWLFRFVDDLELRLDRQAGVIQIRSASRIGRSDLGVNRRRVERLRRTFQELLDEG